MFREYGDLVWSFLVHGAWPPQCVPHLYCRKIGILELTLSSTWYFDKLIWFYYCKIWSRGKLTYSLNHSKTKYWNYITSMNLIYQSNVKWVSIFSRKSANKQKMWSIQFLLVKTMISTRFRILIDSQNFNQVIETTLLH